MNPTSITTEIIFNDSTGSNSNSNSSNSNSNDNNNHNTRKPVSSTTTTSSSNNTPRQYSTEHPSSIMIMYDNMSFQSHMIEQYIIPSIHDTTTTTTTTTITNSNNNNNTNPIVSLEERSREVNAITATTIPPQPPPPPSPIRIKSITTSIDDAGVHNINNDMNQYTIINDSNNHNNYVHDDDDDDDEIDIDIDDLSSIFSDDDVLDDIDFTIEDPTTAEVTSTTTANNNNNNATTTKYQIRQLYLQTETKRRRSGDGNCQNHYITGSIFRSPLLVELLLEQIQQREVLVREQFEQQQQQQSPLSPPPLSPQDDVMKVSEQESKCASSTATTTASTSTTTTTINKNTTTTAVTNTTLLPCTNNNSNSMLNFIIFEYYMTMPAYFNLLLHTIILICVNDCVVDVIITRLLYNFVIHNMGRSIYNNIILLQQVVWKYCIIVLQSMSTIIVPYLPESIVTGFIHYVRTSSTGLIQHYNYSYNTLLQHVMMYQYYDMILYYILLCIIGLICIHYSGYLYWWLSNPIYTLLKFDSHNRIRLLQQYHHHQQQQQQQQQQSTTLRPSSTSVLTTICSTSNPTSSNQQQQHTIINVKNHTNTYIQRFHGIRKIPILRLILYLIGYFICYSISSTILSLSFPYFSQHQSILQYRPSRTFDKEFYTTTATMSMTLPSIDSVSTMNQRPNTYTFPCLIQSCQDEIIRQQYSHVELLKQEQQYTKRRLAKSSYNGYWATWVYHYGDISIYPLFDTIREATTSSSIHSSKQHDHVLDQIYDDKYVHEEIDDDDDNDDDDEEVDEDDDDHEHSTNKLSSIVYINSQPVFSNAGELLFALSFSSIGIYLLYRNGFIFWLKY